MTKQDDTREEILDRIENFIAKLEDKYKIFIQYNVDGIKFNKK